MTDIKMIIEASNPTEIILISWPLVSDQAVLNHTTKSTKVLIELFNLNIASDGLTDLPLGTSSWGPQPRFIRW